MRTALPGPCRASLSPLFAVLRLNLQGWNMMFGEWLLVYNGVAPDLALDSDADSARGHLSGCVWSPRVPQGIMD